MFGLDGKFIGKMDWELAISRIVQDVNTDFIIAPHYNSIFEYANIELWNNLKAQLNNGKYCPLLPVNIEVPKQSGLTRPGAILNPLDRLLYQLIIDLMAVRIEESIDRKNVYSNQIKAVNITNDVGDGKMFVSNTEKYTELKEKLFEYCNIKNYSYAIIADIACYFERIYQHVLINLLQSSEIEAELISLLEKILSAFSSKDSHGIVQGMFPSSVLGNYYLIGFDAFLKSKEIDFVRFVDDYWMFFNEKSEATRTLAEICNYVRKEGLYLNEHKTRIVETDKLHYEENEIDRMFDKAKEEIGMVSIEYNFDPFEIEQNEEEIELTALIELYRYRFVRTTLVEKIDKYCLPRFAIASSNIAIEDAFQGLIERPHLTDIYLRYLRALTKEEPQIKDRLEELFMLDRLNYDWQVMWILGLFYSLDEIKKETVMQAYIILEDNKKSPALRGLCALVSSKHGDGAIRRLVRNRYSDEPSNYVKEAILYSTKHFPSSDDRNACIRAWEGHSTTNELIVAAIKNEIKANKQLS